LFSLRLPGVDVPVELGGMRFLSSHKRVVALVDYFKLAKAELPVSDPGDKHLFYLRGHHSIGADWNGRGTSPPIDSSGVSGPARQGIC
jgi:lysine 2-monooxygenase